MIIRSPGLPFLSHLAHHLCTFVTPNEIKEKQEFGTEDGIFHGLARSYHLVNCQCSKDSLPPNHHKFPILASSSRLSAATTVDIISPPEVPASFVGTVALAKFLQLPLLTPPVGLVVFPPAVLPSVTTWPASSQSRQVCKVSPEAILIVHLAAAIFCDMGLVPGPLVS